MTPEVVIAITISIVSLTVSIISLLISWREFARNRNDLRITVEFLLESSSGTAFKVNLVNRGRRSINIEKILLRLKSGEELTPKLDSKIVLDENEPYICWFPLGYYKSEISSPLDIKQAEVYDSHSKKYSFPLSKLRAQILREWTPENDWLKKNKPTNRA
ncbi:MAG: hypothetical protein ACYC6K_01465 [Bellilinea sp.]